MEEKAEEEAGSLGEAGEVRPVAQGSQESPVAKRIRLEGGEEDEAAVPAQQAAVAIGPLPQAEAAADRKASRHTLVADPPRPRADRAHALALAAASKRP